LTPSSDSSLKILRRLDAVDRKSLVLGSNEVNEIRIRVTSDESIVVVVVVVVAVVNIFVLLFLSPGGP
jgi:hypothetical protein